MNPETCRSTLTLAKNTSADIYPGRCLENLLGVLQDEHSCMVSRDLLGIALECIATFLSAAGLVVQKRSHVQVEAEANNRSYLKTTTFWLGILLMVAGQALTVAVMGLLDQSKQAPMGTLTLVYNSILSYYFLSEKFSVIDGASSFLLIAGTIVALLFSDHTSHHFTFREILDRFHDSVVYAYTAIVLPALALGIVFIEFATARPGFDVSARLVASDDNRDHYSPLPDPEGASNRISSLLVKLVLVCVTLIPGWLGSYNSYCAKTLVTIAYNHAWDEFASPYVYAYIAALIVSIFTQMRYLNKGLALYDSLQVVPIYQSCIVFSNMCSGIVYFHDMRHAAVGRVIGFIAGGICVCAGVAVLTRKPKTGPGALQHEKNGPPDSLSI